MCHHFFRQLAGALAEEGCSLDQIVVKVTEVLKEMGEALFFLFTLKHLRHNESLFPLHYGGAFGAGTLGVSLSPCSVPGCMPSFDLPPGDMELGLGERRWRCGKRSRRKG